MKIQNIEIVSSTQQAYNTGVYVGIKMALREACSVCAEKKTPWDCIKTLAKIHDCLEEKGVGTT